MARSQLAAECASTQARKRGVMESRRCSQQWRKVVAVVGMAVSLAPAPTAGQIDLSGSWQLNWGDATGIASTISVTITHDVASGQLTLTWLDCGTIYLDGAIHTFASCNAPPVNGQLSGTQCQVPVAGFYANQWQAETPFASSLGTCADPPLAGGTDERRLDGVVVEASLGVGTRINGTLAFGRVEVVNTLGVTCFLIDLGGTVRPAMTMLRNDVPAGSGQSAEPLDGVRVTFDRVTAPGQVRVTPLSEAQGELPASFQLLGTPAFYDVTTTASFSGPVTVCLPYPDADNDAIVDGTNPPIDEGQLAVLHEAGGLFVDRTVSRDPTANRVCAQVLSLSQFTLGKGAPPPDPAQQVCRAEIRKRLQSFFSANLAALQRCANRVNSGATTPPCPDTQAAAAIAAAEVDPTKIGKKCPSEVVSTLGLGGSCAGAATAADVAACIVTESGVAVASIVAAEYAQLSAALPSAERKCQVAVAKAGKQYAGSRLRIYRACFGRKDAGKVAACLDSPSQTKLAKAATMAQSTMLKRCTDALVPAVRSTQCATATTAAGLAACQIATHDTETARLITLLP